MEPRDSLPHSHMTDTCPYPEPDQSSPLPNCISTIHFNVILPSSPKFCKWPLSLRFFHQNPVFTSIVSHACYMRRPYHFSWFDHSNNIWWAVQIIKPLHDVVYSTPLLPRPSETQIPSSAPFSQNIIILRSPFSVTDQVSHPYKTAGNTVVPFILIFVTLDSKLENKIFRTE